MRTPSIPLAAVTLALAFAAASTDAFAAPPDGPTPDAPSTDSPAPSAPSSNPYDQGTTADGKTIVAPGTYGPFQGPTCVAGSAGCTAAAAAGDLAGTEGPLMDIGHQQMIESVKKDEDEMVKSGTYKSIERTADGKGAVITLPNGMVSYSDYVHGFDTMPKTPEEMLKDKTLPPGAIAALQKIVDGKNPDKQQADAADKAMFGATSAGRRGNGGPGDKSAAGDPNGTSEAGASEEAPPPADNPPGGQDGATASNDQGNPDISGMGGMIAGANGTGGAGGPTGSAGGSDTQRAANQRAMDDMTRQAVESAGNGELAASGLTYTRLADFARHSRALEDLRNAKVQSSNGADAAADDGVGNDKTARGTSFFGSR